MNFHNGTHVLNSKAQIWLWVLSAVILWLALGLLPRVWLSPPIPTGVGNHEHHHQHHQTVNRELDPATLAKLAADKKESEFNHHLAGLFVALAGIFMLAQDVVVKRWPALKYFWPACFLLAGAFLLVWSDTELWPFGHREWLEALENNREVLQHKIFAALLLALGVIEWRRARGILDWQWLQWAFPVLAIGGSILLLFHQHEAGMHGSNHMEVMSRIQSEHLSFSVVGVGIGLTKGLATLKTSLHAGFAKMWPSLMLVLGILLMFYRE